MVPSKPSLKWFRLEDANDESLEGLVVLLMRFLFQQQEKKKEKTHSPSPRAVVHGEQNR
jgi:hypothetical protein